MFFKKNKSCLKKPGITLVVSYFLLFGVNSLILCLANKYFPKQIVLGTFYISRTWAIIHSMGTLAMLNAFVIPFIREFEEKRKKMLSTAEWLVFYLFLNFAGVWLLARFASELGLGIQSWLAVAILALALNLTQGIVMMGFESLRRKI